MTRRRPSRLSWVVPLICVLSLVAITAIALMGLVEVESDAVPLASVALAFGCVGALVASRQPGNAVGWLFCAIGLAGGVAGSAHVYERLALPGGVWGEWLSTWTGSLILTSIPLVLLLFPDGRPLSPRWRVVVWIAGATIALLAIGDAFAPGRLEDSEVLNPAGVKSWSLLAEGWLGWLAWGSLAASAIAGAASLVLRFRRSRGEQRQQLKWLAAAAALVGTSFAALVATGGESIPAAVVAEAAVLLLPVTAGIAILRYRLYDIDLIINRALVYGSVTAILAAVYALGVVVVGGVLRAVVGQENNSLVVAGSTLAVAALFRPARVRVQAFVDRRFYRRKYDSIRTVDAFATRLRDEVDLDALGADLVAVVRETVQPTHVSFWLRA